jgi:PST family polysaccharide transporter
VLVWLLIGISFAVFDISDPDRLLIAILAIGIVFQSSSVIDLYFQSRVESKYVVRAQLAQLLMSSILKLLLIFFQAELVWFAVVIALDHIFLAGGLYIVYRQQGKKVVSWQIQFSMIKRLVESGLPLMLYAFCVLGLMNTDQIMIKVLRNETEVGWYAAAAMISSVWYFVPVALGSTFNPYMIRQSDREVSNKHIKLLFSILTAITVVGVLVLYFLAPIIVKVLFGSQYEPAAAILAVHILNGIFVFHVSIRSRVLVALHKQWLSTVIMLGALILNVAGNMILIPKFGAVGAAWSSVVAWGISVVFLPLIFSSTRQFVRVFFQPRFSGIRELIDALKS